MKTEILSELRASGQYVSGQQLCERFGVSRTAVWKAVNQLKKEGYEIEAVQNRGYRLVSVPEILSQKELESIRKTKWLGQKIFYYEELDSTNSAAKKLAEDGAPHGSVVVTETQSAGRGRRGRSWASPRGTGIFMTYILKPEIEPANASMLTLVMAMAVAKGIGNMTGIRAAIKWPNDVIADGKKICGILTEMSAQVDYVNYIVIGSGTNVLTESFPPELEGKAASLYMISGKKFHRAELIEEINEQFERYYNVFMETQDMAKLQEEYNQLLVNCGEKVKVLGAREEYEGTAQGITARGELIVDTWEARKLVASGEVSVRGVYGYV
ncbi:MAG: biotin--[acetyl-CoA-carboxylase] ligase [Eubacterium sp.]|nr:biotin--[acetyl-CoA-carboxylase] ligase [Eubacterium sp.]